ncbi:MAG: ion transporter [Luteolibacter sp.]
MSSNTPTEGRERFTRLQVITLILSVYVIGALCVDQIFTLSESTKTILQWVDFGVCMVFLTDFFIRLSRAPSKRAFMKWGWIDFVTSMPMMGTLRFGRALKIIRILRAVRSIKLLLKYAIECGKISPLGTVAIISVGLVFLSAFAIFQFENPLDSPDGNIKTIGDAFWWAYVTITTVGYGDKFPVTVGGRIVAMVLMTAGVGLFGAFTGFVASLFIGTDIRKEDDDIVLLTREIQALRSHLQAIEAKLDDKNSDS